MTSTGAMRAWARLGMVRRGVILAGLLVLAACQPVQLATATPVAPFPFASDNAPPATMDATPPPTRFVATTPTPQESQETTVPTIPTTSTPLDSGLQGLVTRAQEDLARRLNVGVDRVDVVEARSVVWPDTSLGCPQPGMQYLQVPQDGVLIRLSVEGRVYAYHGGGGREPFLCQRKPLVPPPTIPRLDDYVPTPRPKDGS